VNKEGRGFFRSGFNGAVNFKVVLGARCCKGAFTSRRFCKRGRERVFQECFQECCKFQGRFDGIDVVKGLEFKN
jgi:hypothetical protein